MTHCSCYIPSLVILMIFSASAECDILVYTQNPPREIEEVFRDMPAKFGPTLPPEGMRAFVVTGEPRNGCGKLKPPPLIPNPNFTGNWVVLLARYNCSFEEKVRNAQAVGFDGVIVHNVNSSELETMSAKNSMGIKIPSVFVSDNAGSVIDANYLYDEGYFVVLNGDLPFNVNTQLLVPFAIVVSLCLIIMIIFLIVRCLRERRRARRYRLPNSLLKKIPTCKFAKGDPYDTCAICLDDYVEGDKLRVLPCAHAYHCKCIDPWLTKSRRVCPVCKRKVLTNGEKQSRRNNSSRSNDNHSGDSEDDRAPLVQSRASERTSGGTFQRQTENPFTRAAQIAASIRSGTQSSPRLTLRDRYEIWKAHRASINEASTVEAAPVTVESQQPPETSSIPAQSSSSRPPKDRSSREKKRRIRKSAKKSQASESPISHSAPNNSSMDGSLASTLPIRNHPHSSRHVSINEFVPSDDIEGISSVGDEEQGRIGVAALPNTQLSKNRNDFIV